MKKLSVIVLLALLSACGRKGPLYLPDGEGTVVTRPTQTATQPQPNSQTPSQTPKEQSSPTETPKQQPSQSDTEKNQDKPR